MKLTDFEVGDHVIVRRTNGLRNVEMPEDRSGVITDFHPQSEFSIEVCMSDGQTMGFGPHEIKKDVIPTGNSLRIALIELAAQGLYQSCDATILVPTDEVCDDCCENHHGGDEMEIMKDHCKWCEANAAVALFDAIAEPEHTHAKD